MENTIRDVEWARIHYNEMIVREDLSDDMMAIVLLLRASAKQTIHTHSMYKYQQKEQEAKKAKKEKFLKMFRIKRKDFFEKERK